MTLEEIKAEVLRLYPECATLFNQQKPFENNRPNDIDWLWYLKGLRDGCESMAHRGNRELAELKAFLVWFNKEQFGFTSDESAQKAVEKDLLAFKDSQIS